MICGPTYLQKTLHSIPIVDLDMEEACIQKVTQLSQGRLLRLGVLEELGVIFESNQTKR